MVSVLLKHSGAKVLFVESHLLDVRRAALKKLALSSNDGSTMLPVLQAISTIKTPSPAAGATRISSRMMHLHSSTSDGWQTS
jgi:hypothetical protein